MDKLVIEMTEQTEMDNTRISDIRNRLKTHRISLAIDDYGTGFSNISNLIRYNPNYVKIDRSLIDNIQTKPRIQKLVAGIIEFIHENGYFALAEGVETQEELKTMISLGSDLIQGYYLAKPASHLLTELSEALRNEIIELNTMRSEYEIRTYCPKEGEVVDLVTITTNHYNALLIETEHVTIQGASGNSINCLITVRDGLQTHITLRDINITTEKEVPLIDIGNASFVKITLEGKNELINRGIRVPHNSALCLTGSGSLHIHSEMLNSYGIGNARDHSYGNIYIDAIGSLVIDISGENSVAIGGGKNAGDSVIAIRNTPIHIEGSGNTGIGIGNFDGNALVDMKHTSCHIEIASATTVGIGSLSGYVSLLLEDCNLTVIESGLNLCGVGVLSNGSGSISAHSGSISCNLRGRNLICYGSDRGTLDCTMSRIITSFYCEGNVVTGIGDFNGGGNIRLRDSNLAMTILARENLDIGNKYGTLETSNLKKKIRVNE